MSERNGIEIDYCPQCRGVWLDRGELDKIIDRASVQQPTSGHQAPLTQAPQYPNAAPQQQTPPNWAGGAQQPVKKKRENWLSELFDS